MVVWWLPELATGGGSVKSLGNVEFFVEERSESVCVLVSCCSRQDVLINTGDWIFMFKSLKGRFQMFLFYFYINCLKNLKN